MKSLIGAAAVVVLFIAYAILAFGLAGCASMGGAGSSADNLYKIVILSNPKGK